MRQCCHWQPRFYAARSIAVVFFLALYSTLVLYMFGYQSNEGLSVSDVAHLLKNSQISFEDSTDLLRRLAARQAQLSSSSLDENSPEGTSDGSLAVDFQFSVDDSLPIDSLLKTDSIPNNVYYFWCGRRRWFEFNHYLSVRSAIRHFRTDNLIFVYNDAPVVDAMLYHTWFSELKNEYPFFRIYKEKRKSLCLGDNQPDITFILARLALHGGTYVNERVILADYPVELRHHDLVMAFDSRQSQSGEQLPVLLSTRPRCFPAKLQPEQLTTLLKDRSKKTRRLDCPDIAGYLSANARPECVIVDNVPRFFPKDIWNRTDSFGRLARTTFYGTPEIRRPVQRYDRLIPNVAHIVWLGGGKMDFMFYLCVTSLIYAAKVDAVYIHGDGPPGGGYWHLIKDHPKVHLIHRKHPRTMYGKSVHLLPHVSDIWRVDIMIKYGGIYIDTDAVFTRPLDREIRSYDAVASLEWVDWDQPFPDTINLGVSLGKQNAPFWRKLQKSMKWFRRNDWSWNGLRQPYRIKERYPDFIHIDPHLQVICYKSLCHPTWHPNYNKESVHHLNSNSIRNWSTDTYAFHWTSPTPYEIKDHVRLFKSKSMFSEIATYILERAGMLEYFRDLFSTKKSHFDVKPPPYKV